MSQTMKMLVLAFLQNLPTLKEDQFNEAYELYKKSEGKSPSQERKLNMAGFSESGLEHLLYDLQQLHGITDTEIAEKPIVEDAKPEPAIILSEFTKAKLIEFAKENAKQPDPAVEDKVFVLTQNNTGSAEETAALEQEVTPLREEFPFLNADDCPDVLYVVVGKKIATYRAWQAAHDKLQKIDTGELQVDEAEKLETAQLAEKSFRENQELHAELNHFKETGEILGKHPLFRESVAKKEVDEMTPAQLAKFPGSSSKYFTDQKKALEKHHDNPEKIAEINQRIEDRKYKLSLVNAKLGISEAGK